MLRSNQIQVQMFSNWLFNHYVQTALNFCANYKSYFFTEDTPLSFSNPIFPFQLLWVERTSYKKHLAIAVSESRWVCASWSFSFCLQRKEIELWDQCKWIWTRYDSLYISWCSKWVTSWRWLDPKCRVQGMRSHKAHRQRCNVDQKASRYVGLSLQG